MKLSPFLISLLLFLCSHVSGQQHYFRQYSHAEGLVHSFVYDVAQDEKGFLWIGTADGIYRFDGFTFEHYTKDHGLAENFVVEIFKDSRGFLWIGHQNGAITLKRPSGFTPFLGQDKNQGTVSDICEDHQGFIWITSQNTGLTWIDTKLTANTISFPEIYSSLTQLEHIDGNNYLIGTQEGLFRASFNSSIHSMEIAKSFGLLQGSNVMDIFRDKDQGFIVVTQDDGIYHLESRGPGGALQILPIDRNTDGALDYLQGGLIDGSGTLWLFSMGNGLVQYLPEERAGYIRAARISTDNGLVSADIRSMFEDVEGNRWVGLFGEGLARHVDNNIKLFTHFAEEASMVETSAVTGNSKEILVVNGKQLLQLNSNSDSVLARYPLPVTRLGDQVNYVNLDESGRVWLGYDQSGLFVSAGSNQAFKPVFLSNDELSNSVNHITSVGDYTWISTKKGLCRISTSTGKNRWYTTDEGLPHNNINQTYIDRSGRVLIATQCKEIHYINDNLEVAVLEHDPLGPFSTLVCFAEDDQGSLWAATHGNGIWNIRDDTVLNYTRFSGLLTDFCYGLAISEEGKPLVTHTGGISLIDPENSSVKTFSQLEGVKNSTEFYQNALYTDHSGSVWFGTSEGLMRYTPGIATGGLMPPMLVINHLIIDGDTVDYSSGPLHLNAGQYEVHVEYIGISFTHPEMVFYQSQLEGFSRDWSVPTFSRRVTFDQVGHGSYAFKLKAFNENEIVSEITSGLELKIQKPFYLAIWFYSILAILLALGLYLIISIRERNHRMVQERLLKNLDEKSKEIIVKEEIIKERKKVETVLIEAKSKAELSEKLKTSFLQNMSHEIRTPMNAIVGFSQLLKEEGLSENDRNEFIKNVTVNAESLLHLIDDILDVSKLESNQLAIKEGTCDLNQLFLTLDTHYRNLLATEGKVDIKLAVFTPDDQSLEMTTDPVRLKQVLMKLMDNAVKFTESGEIRMGYKPEGVKVLFFVEDTGIGLSEDKKDVIFDLFRKLEEDKLKLYGGTGLGLTLARYLVHLMGGEIDVESHEGFGSKFYFTLPLNRALDAARTEIQESEEPNYKGRFKGKRILVVEDTDSNFLLMDKIFKHTGLIVDRAVNGEVALQKFFHEGPFDLVIMDIKLPGMDGYEITRLIKEKNTNTPVIAHTAYALEGDREKSLEAGCDEYIPKPSEKQALLETISKFL